MAIDNDVLRAAARSAVQSELWNKYKNNPQLEDEIPIEDFYDLADAISPAAYESGVAVNNEFDSRVEQNETDIGTLDSRVDDLEILESLQSPSFENSWVNYGLGQQTAGYYKHAGRVYLQGMVKNGTSSTIFTLPVGYRPSSSERFPSLQYSGAAAQVQVQSNGIVRTLGTNPPNLSLAGISFRQAG